MQDKAIAVIRHALTAANAALDLLEPTQATGDTVGLQVQEVEAQAAPAVVDVQAAPVVVPVVEVAPQTDLSDRLYTELADSQYKLRTVAELCSKFGVTSSALYDALDDKPGDYITKTRRYDAAPLVGLSSRN